MVMPDGLLASKLLRILALELQVAFADDNICPAQKDHTR